MAHYYHNGFEKNIYMYIYIFSSDLQYVKHWTQISLNIPLLQIDDFNA